jgi:hypothetical protein
VTIGDKGRAQLQRIAAEKIKLSVAETYKDRVTFSQVGTNLFYHVLNTCWWWEVGSLPWCVCGGWGGGLLACVVMGLSIAHCSAGSIETEKRSS